MDAIELNVFSGRIAAICDEMGVILQRSALSPNIKDRLDFSCALFDARGKLCAQAAHIPVHLGSMAFAMADIVSGWQWQPGDMVMVNDPFMGGTHLPDVTLIAPIFLQGSCVGYVANRAHHANIGADSPGSMPVSLSLEEEGVRIPPTLLLRQGEIQAAARGLLSRIAGCEDASETLEDTLAWGDFFAQISANQIGLKRVGELVGSMGSKAYQQGLAAINRYASRLSREALKPVPDGAYTFVDYMEDDGAGQQQIPLKVTLVVEQSRVVADFQGTAGQVRGNINCPASVTAAAVFYVFRCLMPPQIPACAGAFEHLTLKIPEGSVLNARYPAAVAAGNVETSSRVVDLVIGALARALPEQMPAASQGTMNNVAMGSRQPGRSWDYYETVAGGTGASAAGIGLSAVHSHMTNTLNTPIESLERHYPLRITRYALRRESGGKGTFAGGNGVIREYQFLAPGKVSLLTERRTIPPWGVNRGEAAKTGCNWLNGRLLPAKCEVTVAPGDRLTIETPGGGGWSSGSG